MHTTHTLHPEILTLYTHTDMHTIHRRNVIHRHACYTHDTLYTETHHRYICYTHNTIYTIHMTYMMHAIHRYTQTHIEHTQNTLHTDIHNLHRHTTQLHRHTHQHRQTSICSHTHGHTHTQVQTHTVYRKHGQVSPFAQCEGSPALLSLCLGTVIQVHGSYVKSRFLFLSMVKNIPYRTP